MRDFVTANWTLGAWLSLSHKGLVEGVATLTDGSEQSCVREQFTLERCSQHTQPSCPKTPIDSAFRMLQVDTSKQILIQDLLGL